MAHLKTLRSTSLTIKYKIEQITSKHVQLYNNVRPSDIGLWVYIIDNRPYGFKSTEQGAIASARDAVGDD